MLDPKKVLQARPWPKKSPTAQNVTQKSPIKKINNNHNNNSREFQQFLRPPFFNLVNETDTKTRTLGFAFCQPPKKSLPKSLTQKSHHKISNPKKVLRSQFQTRTSPSLIYLSTSPPPWALTCVFVICVQQNPTNKAFAL